MSASDWMGLGAVAGTSGHQWHELAIHTGPLWEGLCWYQPAIYGRPPCPRASQATAGNVFQQLCWTQMGFSLVPLKNQLVYLKIYIYFCTFQESANCSLPYWQLLPLTLIRYNTSDLISVIISYSLCTKLIIHTH